ncbi:MAG: MBL fold metallo-hydrolase [Gammaproteobacteria bacterium]|jgi:glyoxylase-like metal-dependent hydrolase (beta-lactamase superfamily II)|nr:MBL fold metallo-hydrolase [Gammaproteobacteria bacterium]MDH4004371.1 MBL fold metallo-hydrolase [Gammaproteobacteria bacterium]NCF59529.1 MBL fold metallo-hydrolase [Gammaproteobacteria bacterium]
MKSIISLVLAGVLASSLVCADNLTEKNVAAANEVIDAALEAHAPGGKLEDLGTLIIEFDRVVYSFGQSRGTEPPWDKSESSGFSAIDLDNSVFVTRTTNSGGGFESHNGTIINADESYQLDYRAGTAAKISEPDLDTASGPFIRVSPPLLVRTLAARRANAYYLGETQIDGVDYDVVGFSMTVGPAISLYFDKDSHLLRRSERIFAGVGLVQYEFLDYETINGIAVNRTFNLFINGDANVEQKNRVAKVDKPLDHLLAVDARLDVIPEVQPDPLSRQEIADGVWLIGGNGTYVMFVDMGDYVFAAGGTAGLPERIDSLREVVGEKPLRYGMLTHHHFDHVMGVGTYEEEGAVLIASAAHEKIVREAAADGEALKLETVADRMTLEGETRSIEIIDIGPTAHTEHLLVAYLPEEQILFEADHFAMPQAGPMPPAVSSTRTFAEALGRKELTARLILSAHSPRAGTMDDLRAALTKEVFQASR